MRGGVMCRMVGLDISLVSFETRFLLKLTRILELTLRSFGQVYVNEYEDLPGGTSEVGRLTTTPSPAASSGVIDISCDLGETCSPASECNSITTEVEVSQPWPSTIAGEYTVVIRTKYDV